MVGLKFKSSSLHLTRTPRKKRTTNKQRKKHILFFYPFRYSIVSFKLQVSIKVSPMLRLHCGLIFPFFQQHSTGFWDLICHHVSASVEGFIHVLQKLVFLFCCSNIAHSPPCMGLMHGPHAWAMLEGTQVPVWVCRTEDIKRSIHEFSILVWTLQKY